MKSEAEQQTMDPFEELAAATEAVTVARRRLAIADERLRKAMVNYIGDNAGEGRASPEQEKALVRGRIIDRVVAIVRAAGGASVTTAAIVQSTGAERPTICSMCSKLTRDPASGIVRVKNGVFAYLPEQAMKGSPVTGASKVGRPMSEITLRIDEAVAVLLKDGARLSTWQIVASVSATIGSDVKARTIINRLYRRERDNPPTLLAHYEPIGRVYSLPVSRDAGEGAQR